MSSTDQYSVPDSHFHTSSNSDTYTNSDADANTFAYSYSRSHSYSIQYHTVQQYPNTIAGNISGSNGNAQPSSDVTTHADFTPNTLTKPDYYPWWANNYPHALHTIFWLSIPDRSVCLAND